jgi:hypothetical protein
MLLLAWNRQRNADFRGACAIDVVEQNVKILRVVMPHDVLGSTRCKAGLALLPWVYRCTSRRSHPIRALGSMSGRCKTA